VRSVTPPEAQQGRLVLLQTNDFPKDRMNNVVTIRQQPLADPSTASAELTRNTVSRPVQVRRLGHVVARDQKLTHSLTRESHSSPLYIGRQEHDCVLVFNSLFIVTAWYTRIPNLCFNTSHCLCPLHRVPTRPLSHLTSHSRDGSHLGQGPNKCEDIYVREKGVK
jgi:hypothetical protein